MDENPSDPWSVPAPRGKRPPPPPPAPSSPSSAWARPASGDKRGFMLGEAGLLMDVRERLELLLAEQRQTNQLLARLVEREAP